MKIISRKGKKESEFYLHRKIVSFRQVWNFLSALNADVTLLSLSNDEDFTNSVWVVDEVMRCN